MGNKPSDKSQQGTSHKVLLMYQQLINRDFDDHISMIAAKKYPNNLEKSVNFILNSRTISTDQHINIKPTINDDEERKQIPYEPNNDNSECNSSICTDINIMGKYNQHLNPSTPEQITAVVYESKPIMKCIGRMISHYGNHCFVGTGTVFAVQKVTQKAFIISNASRGRLRGKECKRCNKLKNIRDRHCGCGAKLTKTLQSPTKIEFLIGQTERRVDVKVEYISESYLTFWNAFDGYDLGIYSFIDRDDFFSQHVKNIVLTVGLEALVKGNPFNLYGFFQFGRQFALCGLQSNRKNYKIQQSESSKKYHLRQREIQASIGRGEAGSAIWIENKESGMTEIFAIHTGKNRYEDGLANLIRDEELQLILKCISVSNRNPKVVTVSRKPQSWKDDIVCYGYLEKESLYLKKCSTLWVVFKGHCLYAYKNKDDEKPAEIID
eukprot:262952_1